MMNNKKVLVTGSEGFIGSHLVERLVELGFDVRAFVLYNSFNSWGWLENLPKDKQACIDVFLGDVRDPNSVRQAVKGVDTVFHLASLIAIPYSYVAPDAYLETNAKGTLNVLQAVKDAGVERLIHTSTSEVYGTAQFVPITESHPLQGQSPYSATKIAADQLALSFFRSFETPVTIVRPFNTYGPRQSARAIIPTVITQLLSGTDEIKVGALTPTRDFNYVKDTVEGFIAASKATGALGDVINVGSNFEISMGDTIQLIADVMQREVNITLDEQRLRPQKSEVERLWADNTKAREVLDWQPAFGGKEGFKKGLAETVAWFSDDTNLRQYKTHLYNV